MTKIPIIVFFFSVSFSVVVGSCNLSFPSEKAKEDFNKRTVLKFYRESFSNLQNFDAVAKKYIPAEGYIQHSPNFRDGRQELIDRFLRFYGNSTRNPILHIAHVTADGDLVWVHELDIAPNTDELSVNLNLYRLECGLIYEHWDVVQPVQANATYANSHPFF